MDGRKDGQDTTQHITLGDFIFVHGSVSYTAAIADSVKRCDKRYDEGYV